MNLKHSLRVARPPRPRRNFKATSLPPPSRRASISFSPSTMTSARVHPSAISSTQSSPATARGSHGCSGDRPRSNAKTANAGSVVIRPTKPNTSSSLCEIATTCSCTNGHGTESGFASVGRCHPRPVRAITTTLRYRPLLAETLTDPEAYAGICYMTGGWTPLGFSVGPCRAVLRADASRISASGRSWPSRRWRCRPCAMARCGLPSKSRCTLGRKATTWWTLIRSATIGPPRHHLVAEWRRRAKRASARDSRAAEKVEGRGGKKRMRGTWLACGCCGPVATGNAIGKYSRITLSTDLHF